MDMLLAAIIVYCVDRHLTGMSLSGGFISYFFFSIAWWPSQQILNSGLLAGWHDTRDTKTLNEKEINGCAPTGTMTMFIHPTGQEWIGCDGQC